MIRPPSAPLLACLAALLGCSCKSTETEFTGTIPPGAGLACSATATAADSGGLTASLASAGAGTCVVLTGATYAGPFTVPAGVSVVAQNGSRAAITGGTAQAPTVTLGEGSGLFFVDLADAPGVAVAVRAANAVVNGVTVSGAKSAALAIRCTEAATPGCATGTVKVLETKLATSTMGLWVSGAHLVMTGGSSSSHTSTSLASAAGLVAVDGARIELDGVTIEKNQGVGVLVDGPLTTAAIKNGTINENAERGVWLQKVAGTLDAPSVQITDTKIERNKIVGLGALSSHGIVVKGGRVAETVAAPLPTNLESTEQVGDGFGLFSSADVKLDGTTIEANARSAGVVDVVDTVQLTGIIIVGGGAKIGAEGVNGLKIVVQEISHADVQIDVNDRSIPPAKLGVSAPSLAVPSVL
ncbi:MAG: hypothetical protein JWP97_109 [Labilithrix sp.]|nr:hypothetical protein [Labilithrix sp.]